MGSGSRVRESAGKEGRRQEINARKILDWLHYIPALATRVLDGEMTTAIVV